MSGRAAGTAVLVQEVWRDRVWAARPMTVVADDEVVALWMPQGTRWRAPDAVGDCAGRTDRAARRRCAMLAGTWSHLDRVWKMNTLWLSPRDEPYAVWVCWDEAWRVLGWYVNFQEPMAASDKGFVTFDWFLDLRVDAAGTVEVKDEDEFSTAATTGLLGVREYEDVRSRVPLLTAQAAQGSGVFDPRWTRWRPPPTWPQPGLPNDWKRR
jgi:predicted RNA-binding protein associated with RNAse of E/G family